jgi:hypothetical protein
MDYLVREGELLRGQKLLTAKDAKNCREGRKEIRESISYE